jgi:hypothetical protein
MPIYLCESCFEGLTLGFDGKNRRTLGVTCNIGQPSHHHACTCASNKVKMLKPS